MKIEPHELDFLRKVAAANGVGADFHMNATPRTRADGQSRRIGALIGHGLLEDRAGVGEDESFFSKRSRSYALQVTALGHECLAALAKKP